MVFLAKISLWFVAIIFAFLLNSCVNQKESFLVKKYISEEYVDSSASFQTLDRYSKVLDENKSFDLHEKLQGKTQSIVSIRLKRDIIYFKISTFGKKITQTIEKVCKDISPKSGIIIDLRNNGGGYLSEAVSLVDLFVNKGIILRENGRNKIDSKIYYAHTQSTCEGIPLAVLVNAKSASASEIVSGVLQIYKKAIVLGSKTFGKGTIQKVIPLPKHKLLKLTVSNYVLKDNRIIEGIGIYPDIYISHGSVHFASNVLIAKQVKQEIYRLAKRKSIDSVLQIGFYILTHDGLDFMNRVWK